MLSPYTETQMPNSLPILTIQIHISTISYHKPTHLSTIQITNPPTFPLKICQWRSHSYNPTKTTSIIFLTLSYPWSSIGSSMSRPWVNVASFCISSTLSSLRWTTSSLRWTTLSSTATLHLLPPTSLTITISSSSDKSCNPFSNLFHFVFNEIVKPF